MRWRIGFAWLATCAGAAVAQNPLPTRAVFLTGDVVGQLELTNASTVNSICINDAGGVLFAGQLAAGSLRQVRETAGVLSLLDGPNLNFGVNANLANSGHAVWGTTTVSYAPPAGATQTLTSSAIAVPGVPGSNFQALDQFWGAGMVGASINSTGFCGFRHSFSATGGTRRGTFFGSPGAITTVAVTDPSAQPQPRVTGLGTVSINDQSQMTFTRTTSVSSSVTRREVLLATASTLLTILSTDQPVVGPPGGSYGQFTSWVGINNAGSIVFGASIAGDDQNTYYAIMLYQNGQLERLYTVGDVVTLADGTSLTLFQLLDVPLNAPPVIGDGGHIAFPVVAVQNGQPARMILRRDPDGDLHVIAREGQVVTLGSPFPLTIGSALPLSPSIQLNEHGEALIMLPTQISGPPLPFASRRDGRLVALAVPGAQVSLRGESYTIESVSTGRPAVPTGGGDGRSRIWNDRSECVFAALLTRPLLPAVSAILVSRLPQTPLCDSIDFNNDGSVFDPDDVDAFFSVFSEGPCVPVGATCNDIDFNNDGSLFDPQDVDAFFSVFSEGPCL
jgi:hypothetical protein